MEIRTLCYFLVVANEKNITKAADILHVTQPTLSRQLSNLERELGTTLIVRGKRSLTLTEDGILFRQRAEEIIEMTKRVEQEFVSKNNTVRGSIKLGATEAVGGRVLAKCMKQFSEKYPDVQFELNNEMADSIKEQIDRGLLDLGLVIEPVDITKYEFMPLSEKEIWGILVNEKHPFAKRESVEWQELVFQPLMLPNRLNVRREILSWIGCEERSLNVAVNYNLLSNVALLVKEGMGVAVCLNGAMSIRCCPTLRFIPLIPEHATKSVLIWKKNQLFNQITSLFLRLIQRHSGNME